MRRRTLDFVVSGGGLALAVALLVLGLVMAGNANFAKDYVADQLGEQQINFKPAEALTPEEAQSECLVEYAGQPLTTGKQAECYANDFIGLHLKADAEGMTYATMGSVEREIRGQIEAAEQAGDPSLPALRQQLADASATRETLFKGETLRGLLLTTYGFSIFGEKAGLAGNVLYGAAAVLALLAIAGFAHALVTPKDKPVRLAERLVGPNGVSKPPGPKARPKAAAKSPGGSR